MDTHKEALRIFTEAVLLKRLEEVTGEENAPAHRSHIADLGVLRLNEIPRNSAGQWQRGFLEYFLPVSEINGITDRAYWQVRENKADSFGQHTGIDLFSKFAPSDAQIAKKKLGIDITDVEALDEALGMLKDIGRKLTKQKQALLDRQDDMAK